MSRKFNLNLGPRDQKDEDRLLRFIFRQAQSGDDIRVDFSTTSPQPSQPNDQLGQRLADRVEEQLAKENQRRDVKATSAPTDLQVGAQKRATEIVRSRKSVREIFNEVGCKVFIELVLKAAWQHMVQNWEQVEVHVREVLTKLPHP